jgi:glycine hydroxymethyltransferase
MASALFSRGYELTTGGTDNHLMVVNVKRNGVTGNKMQEICDAIHVTLNKNTVVGDSSPMNPSGVRIGTPAITSRGYLEDDSKEVARFLDEAAKLAVELQARSGSKKLTDFKEELLKSSEVKDLGQEVQNFSI